jgi:UDP-N-acetylmuramate dehydrogenase
MQIEENKPLAPFTTFGIGGPARWFVEARSEVEVAEATAWADAHKLPLFVLGGGSNLLVSDAGFDGLVLHIALKGVASHEIVAGQRLYQVAGGEDWDRLVQWTVDDGCAGVECMAGIPGTVGGTPVQNVGAYGQEVSSVVERVRVFDLEDRGFREIPVAECGFAYRRSRFNSTDRGRFIVTRVDFRLTPGGAPAIRYADLQRAFAADLEAGRQPALADVAVEVRRIRLSKGMLLVEGDSDCRSAGSFFKNPIVPEALADAIAAASPLPLPRFPAGNEQAATGQNSAALVKLPAAWLIEQAGFHKGDALGPAAVSTRHTLALTNRGDATAADILALAGQIRGAVQARFGIELEMEPVMLGF